MYMCVNLAASLKVTKIIQCKSRKTHFSPQIHKKLKLWELEELTALLEAPSGI